MRIDQEPKRYSRRSFLSGVVLAPLAVLTACQPEKERVAVDPTPAKEVNKTVSVLPPVPAELNKLKYESIRVPNIVRVALESVTNPYSGEKRTELQRLRQVNLTEATIEQLITQARNGSLFIEATHPALLTEFDNLADWAKKSETTREKLLDVYADSILATLERIYGRDSNVCVALEPGHWSNAPLDKIAKENNLRVQKGWIKLSPTQDTGTSASLPDGRTIREKDVNLAVAQLIALKTMQGYPKWIPVLSTKEDGFPAERFIQKTTPQERFYITHKDSLIPLKARWERLGAALRQANIPMVRFSLHCDSTGLPTGKNQVRGSMVPQNDLFKAESLRLATIAAEELNDRVDKLDPSYNCKARQDWNNDPESPYWTIDDYSGDNPLDVQLGLVEKVRGATNKYLAQVRREWLEK